jgi:hypothetical protein
MIVSRQPWPENRKAMAQIFSIHPWPCLFTCYFSLLFFPKQRADRYAEKIPKIAKIFFAAALPTHYRISLLENLAANQT